MKSMERVRAIFETELGTELVLDSWSLRQLEGRN